MKLNKESLTLQPLLAAQIEKYLGGEINEENLQKFISVVSETYRWFERDKKISEHAFSVSENEYQEVLGNMKTQNDIIKESVSKLREAILSIDPGAGFLFENDEPEILNIISYLSSQISIRRELELELIESKDAAEAAAKAKSDFLSVMSHEIKTPLNAIIGLSHLLMQDTFPPTQAKNIATLHAAAENLLRLINDILDFNKIEEGKIVLSERSVDLKVQLTQLKNTHLLRAEEKENHIKLLLDPDLPKRVMVDDTRLNQVLHNLVSNAVKFTSNGTITIQASVERQTPSKIDVLFSVKDTGIGIEPEKHSQIFEHFTQADSNITRKYGGSGLGLSIVKRILQLMGSEIKLQSEPNRGSEFHFTLSLKKSVESVEEPVTTRFNESFNLSGISVLIVDDIEFNIMVAEQMLASCQAGTDHARNGEEAIAKMKSSKYDLVLMDLQMPVLDGFKATMQIRRFDEATPIIALTASSDTSVLSRCKDVGMNDYLMKPFNPSDFFNMVLQYTKGQEAAS
ncbi:MAG: ATP-binding protein [Chitinophagaceae bacterium]|nr:ATP-binding protein [Chitinophagaceae bacterium]